MNESWESWEFFRISDFISSSIRLQSHWLRGVRYDGTTGVAKPKPKAKKKKLWVQGLCSN